MSSFLNTEPTRRYMLPPSTPLRCAHLNRVPYTPESSVGDESDYESQCFDCGMVLRDPPNRRTARVLVDEPTSKVKP